MLNLVVRDSIVGIATRYGLDGPEIESRWGEIFHSRPDRPWGSPSLLHNGYRVSFPGVKRPGRGASYPIPSSCRGSRTGRAIRLSTPPLGPSGPLIGWTFTFTWWYVKLPLGFKMLIIVSNTSRSVIRVSTCYTRSTEFVIAHRSANFPW
jgi:hypothetical protein